MGTHVHVFPVDSTLTLEDAWKELCIFGKRVTDTGKEKWGTFSCDGEECRLMMIEAANQRRT